LAVAQLKAGFHPHPQALQFITGLTANGHHVIATGLELPAVFQADPTVCAGDQKRRHREVSATAILPALASIP